MSHSEDDNGASESPFDFEGVPEPIVELALGCVQYVQRSLGFELDFEPETLPLVEHYARQNAKQWIYRIYNERDDVLAADSINTKVSLSEIYAQVKFRSAELRSGAVN